MPLFGNLLQPAHQRLKIGRLGIQQLVAEILAPFIADAQQVPHQGGVPFGVRQLVRIQVAYGADHGFQQFGRVNFVLLQEGRRLVVNLQGGSQVGIAVGQVG